VATAARERIAAEQNARADAPRTTGAHRADLVAETAPPDLEVPVAAHWDPPEAWAEFDRALRGMARAHDPWRPLAPAIAKLALTGFLIFLKNARGDFRFWFGNNRMVGGAICLAASRETVRGWSMVGGPAGDSDSGLVDEPVA
jgi:hypothetical protein